MAPSPLTSTETAHAALDHGIGDRTVQVDLSQSFVEGLNTHTPALRSAARAMAGNVPDADDLVQETLLRAMRFAGRFQRGTNLKGWLKTILRNSFINQFRRARRRPAVFGSEESEQLIASAPARDESPIQIEPEQFEASTDHFSASLRDAVHSLPEKYRQVFLLFALGGYKYREIADRMGIPVGTVMSRLHRARAALHASLDGRALEG